jgi:hypothetical protein
MHCGKESEIFTTEIDIAPITNITHQHNYQMRSERRDIVFHSKTASHKIQTPASCTAAVSANHYAIPHPWSTIKIS